MNFSEKVYKIVRKIPKGKVTTYKAIADSIGTKAYRAVGTALKKNKDLTNIKCFKVIPLNGSIGNYSKGQQQKIQLLKKEGIIIKDNKVGQDQVLTTLAGL